MRKESRKARVAAALELLVQVTLELGRGGALGGGEVQRSRRHGCRSGTRPCCDVSWRAERLGHAILSCGSSGASSTRAVIASWAGSWASCRSAVNTGVRRARPRTTPMWRAPIVQPACWTRGSRIAIAWAVSRSTVSPRPEAHQRLRRDRPGEVGRRRDRQPGEAAGDQEAPHSRLDGRRRPQQPRERTSGQGSEGDDGHGHGGGRRRPAPSLDQQQDEQEQRQR